ncbi:hypothetical protein FRC10_006400 [Ceratobasidium sp. 414]|nr:hypothetical protein FRC10_006400 [Ceratobasidium sp. 414]
MSRLVRSILVLARLHGYQKNHTFCPVPFYSAVYIRRRQYLDASILIKLNSRDPDIRYRILVMPLTEGELIPCPYVVGAKFRLRISFPSATSEVHVTVVHAYDPFTISPVMRVSVDYSLPSTSDDKDIPTARLPTEMILKVYDRRFALSLREHPAEDFERLEEEMAAALGCSYRDSSNAPVYLLEHHVTLAMEPYFEDECAAYHRLKPLQGHHIPTFYGATELVDGCSASELNPPIQGVLLEVIPGVGLDQVDPAAVDLEALIRNAVRIVETYSELGVINKDVRLGNFIVKPDGWVVMIDFAQSELRDEYECEKAWWIGKNIADEENRIYSGAERRYNRPWAGPRPKYPRELADGIEYVDGRWRFVKGFYKGI